MQCLFQVSQTLFFQEINAPSARSDVVDNRPLPAGNRPTTVVRDFQCYAAAVVQVIDL